MGKSWEWEDVPAGRSVYVPRVSVFVYEHIGVC